MNVTYKVYGWEFNGEAFAAAVTQWVEDFGKKDVAEALGVTTSCVMAWAKGSYSDGFPHPNMSNFLIVCNTLDIDPRDMFALSES